jgi:penicillin amidase
MYLELQDHAVERETTLGLLHEALPRELFEFLTPLGSWWDAPLVGGPLTPPPPPGPETFDLRETGQPAVRRRRARPEASMGAELLGSNNWAVAGWRTADGGALLANDMHLGLAVPNIWYRAAFEWTEPDGVRLSVCGLTLPGGPALVAGSNGRVAWGFTNSHGDFADLVVVETTGDGDHYLTPDGVRRFERIVERIEVRGEPEERLEIVSTIWGPIVDRDRLGRPRALRWVAHDPRAADIEVLDLELAANLGEALEIAGRSGIPTQNFVAADGAGRIGWTLMGPLPVRFGMTGRLPGSWADGSQGWSGWLESADYPRIADLPSGQIWSANNRVGDLEMQRKIGYGSYSLGARAGQIRDDLLALEEIEPDDLLEVQLDDRALFLEPWRELLLELLTTRAVGDDERRQLLLDAARDSWTGRASVDSVGYRIVRAFRLETAQRVFAPLTAPCEALDERCDYLSAARWEAPLWQLVTERPPHLLDPAHASWRELLLDAADGVLDYFLPDDEATLADATWGARNTVRIRHPISRAVPSLSRWLDMPPVALPGDSGMPRVQSIGFGASQRMVVSPGREEHGIFHMPTGQSGHPLSPHYRKGHEAWVEGRATPFLPGEAVHSLTLLPG